MADPAIATPPTTSTSAAAPTPTAPAAPSFDVAGARNAGYSDGDIATYLAGKTGFDIQGARKAGYDDSDIIDHLEPAPAPEPKPVGTFAGIGHAIVQGLGEAETSLVGGAGAIAQSAATYLQNRQNQVDPNDTETLAHIASLKSAGSELSGAAPEIAKAAATAFPLDPDEQDRFSVKTAKMVTGLSTYLGAAYVGGIPALMGLSGTEGFDQHYDAAKQKGVSDETAAAAGLFGGLTDAALMTVPVGMAFKAMDAIPGAFKGDFLKAVTEATKSGVTLTAFSQLQTLADNVIAKNTYDPTRGYTDNLGQNLGETFLAGAVLPVVGGLGGMGAKAVTDRIAPTPEAVAAPVMQADNVDDAINAAKTAAAGPATDINTAPSEQDRPSDLFGGLNKSTIDQTDDGTYKFSTFDDEGVASSTPMKPWEPGTPNDDGAATISPDLAQAQKDHYGKLGVDVVYFQNDPNIPFDGAVSPDHPDTIFLSNDPTRNAAQIGAHEMTHVLESTTLPDGTNLGDLLHQQVKQGMTSQGWDYAKQAFGATAPDRANFAPGYEGDADHADAVVTHLVSEMGADIGGEAPKFQTFAPQVVDAIQARYGTYAAKDVLQKLMDGVKAAFDTMRQFFGGDASSTVSQNWVTNLAEIHKTLADMYAAKYGEQSVEQFASDEGRPSAPETPQPGEDAAQILVRPEVKAAIETPRDIDRTHDVPYLAGSSNTGDVTYIDRRVPEQMTFKGTDGGTVTADPAKFLNIHEQTEHALMVEGDMSYKGAHEIATGKELAAVRAAGIDPVDYQRQTLNMAKNVTEGEKATNPPPDLYTKPYPHTEAEFLAHEGEDEARVGASETSAPMPVPGADQGAPEVHPEYTASVVRSETYRRWLDELDTKRREDALASPKASFLRQTAASILGKVGGVEARLTKSAANRLADVRQALDEHLNPKTDNPDMARVRQELTEENQRRSNMRLEQRGVQFSPKTEASAEDVHQIAEERHIPSDDDPHFMAMTQRLTGKERLDDLTPQERAAVYNHVASFDSRPPVDLMGERGGEETDGGPAFSPKITGADRETQAYTPEQIEAYKNVGRITDPPSMRERFDAARADLGKRLIRYWLDPYIGVKADDPNGYMALRNANSVGGAVEMFLTDGRLKFDGSTYAMADRNGGVEHLLIRPLQGEQDRFLWWVAANRAERLSAEDRENLWSPEDIAAIKGTNQGTTDFDYQLPNGEVTRSREAIYLDSLKKLDLFNKNTMDLAVEAGLLPRGKVDALWSNPFYVPFYRQAEDNSQFVGPKPSSQFVKQSAFKTLKGGAEKLNHDLWQNALGNWSHLIDASLRNRAAARVLDVATNHGNDAAREVSQQEIDHQMTKEQKANVVWVMKGGEKQYYEITDPFLHSAITALDFTGFHNPIMQGMQWFKKILTMGVTSDPRFMLRIAIRDSEQAIATAPMSYNMVSNLITGFKMNDVGEAMQNVARAVAGRELERQHISDEAANAIAGGAAMRLGSGQESGFRKTNLDTMLDSPGKVQAFWHYISTVARAYKGVSALGEDVNRLALYHKLIADGVPHDAAAFAGRDLEDFTLKGAGAVARTLTQSVAFMNAWAQGLYKVGRAAANSDKSIGGAVAGQLARSTTRRVAIVVGATAMASLALDALYKDDEDYKKRTDDDRNSNFWFKFGGTAYRIPMGFEIGALARIAANGAEVFYDPEMTGRRFLNNFYSMLMTNMSMSPIPQALHPIYDLATNTSGTGSAIEPMGMENLQSQERYTSRSTLAARGISDVGSKVSRGAFGPQAQFLSPIQIDYLTQGYFGWLGAFVTGTADRIAREALSVTPYAQPVRPSMDLWNFATGGMVSTQSTAQSRYVDLMYQQADGINKAYGTYMDLLHRQQPQAAQEYFKENLDLMIKHKSIDGLTKFESEANQRIRFIENNTKLSADQKQVQIMQLNAMKNRAAENVFGVRKNQ